MLKQLKAIEDKYEGGSLTVTLSNLDSDIKKEFIRFFSFMDLLKGGASRTVNLHMDGDGTFRVDVKIDKGGELIPEDQIDDELQHVMDSGDDLDLYLGG